MQVNTIEIDRDAARARVEEFTAKRRRDMNDYDRALYQGYKALSEGLAIVDMRLTMRDAGLHEATHLPKLAVCRADARVCWFQHQLRWATGEVAYGGLFQSYRDTNDPVWKEFRALVPEGVSAYQVIEQQGLRIEVEDCFTVPDDVVRKRSIMQAMHSTMVPEIPFQFRPKPDELKDYFILWEVERWTTNRAPGDPFLLRRLAGDLFVVVAQWDLSDLERKVLEAVRRER